MEHVDEICSLCGKAATVDDPITREHTPPLQFYPKSLRAGLQLWTDVPTHRSCNQKHKLDEEYFYHATYPLVARSNPGMARIILEDLRRRAKKSQTPNLLRRILRTSRSTTKSGLALPPGIVSLDADIYRLQQVALKIARCLFYRDNKRMMPVECCKDIRLCEQEEDVPELYKLSWELCKIPIDSVTSTSPGGVLLVDNVSAGAPTAVDSKVFDYRSSYIEDIKLHLYTMRFWEAFMFCLAFEEPVAL